jgi:hypothetical protein
MVKFSPAMPAWPLENRDSPNFVNSDLFALVYARPIYKHNLNPRGRAFFLRFQAVLCRFFQ